MKKAAVIGLLLICSLILQTGCAGRSGGEDTLSAGIPGESPIPQETILSETDAGSSAGLPSSGPFDSSEIPGQPEYTAVLPRELEAVKAALSEYSNDLETLAAPDSYVILHGQEYSGQRVWEDFYKNVSNKTPAELVLVQFTVEGDAILYYVNYDGNDFYVVSDFSRDAFAGSGDKYREANYPYLAVWDNTMENGDFERIIVLSDMESLTSDQYDEYTVSQAPDGLRVFELAYIVLGNEHAVLTGKEAWHDVSTTFDESTVLIAPERIARIEVTDGNTGEILTLEEGDDFQKVLSLYKALDFQPDDALGSRSGYAYQLRLFDADGEYLQSVTPYKDGVQINGTLYDSSMNGTSIQLLQELYELY